MRHAILLAFFVGKGTLRLIPELNPASWLGRSHFGSISNFHRKWKFSGMKQQRFLAVFQAL